MTLEFPAGSRSDSYQVNFESEIGCTYPGAKADVTFTCVSVLIFDSEDMLEMGVELDTPATHDVPPDGGAGQGAWAASSC